MATTDMILLGVPIDSVGRSGGTEHGPAALREHGLVDVVGEDGGDLDVRVRGEDRDPRTGILGSPDVLRMTAVVRTAVRDAIARGHRPFLAGGCCAELPGALAGARDAVGRVGLAYLDGHADLYDGDTSPTGEAADMPISVILGLGPHAWTDAAGGAGAAPENVAVLGTRDLVESLADGMRDPAATGIDHRDVEALRREGPAVTGAAIARRLAGSPGRFWLHLDVDVLDQDVFPATDYLMPGGLDWIELGEVMRPLASSPALIGASVACYNPEKDPDGSCGRALVEAWREALAG
jgi:arginase